MSKFNDAFHSFIMIMIFVILCILTALTYYAVMNNKHDNETLKTVRTTAILNDPIFK